MTPADLRTARQTLGLSAEGFARAVGAATGRTVRKWEAGDRDIPGPVVVLMDLANRIPRVADELRKRASRPPLG